MIRRPPRSTLSSSSAASDVYKRQKLLFLLLEYPVDSRNTYVELFSSKADIIVIFFQCSLNNFNFIFPQRKTIRDHTGEWITPVNYKVVRFNFVINGKGNSKFNNRF